MKLTTAPLSAIVQRIPVKYRSRRYTFPAGAAVLALFLFLALTATHTESVATVDAAKGEFFISIKSSGEIRATNSFTLVTPRLRYGQMQIIFLIPEGTTVKPGDVVVRFATTDVDKLIADKESELSINRSDLDKYRADRDLLQSEIEGNLRNAELSYEQAKLQVEKMKFEADVQRKETEINLERNRIAFEQAKKKVESQAVVSKSEERKYLLKVQQTENDLKRAKDDKEQYTLKSTLGGLVVYENNWNTGRKVAVGDSPWGGMPLVSLPDLSAMQSVTNVNEVEVSKVKKGQVVRIRLDAFPDKEFQGTVASVGTIGQQRDQSTTKTFEVIVDITGTDPVLKPGMTSGNEIVMSTIPDVISIPIEAVFEKDGKTIAYVNSHPREITLGEKNSNFVIVTKGLEPGEKVALRDPEAAATAAAGASKESKQ
jgi:hypothetical protein